MTGKDAEDLLHKVNITVNKNLIPYDTQPAQTASGIRIGTPAVCSRGFGVEEAIAIADIIDEALKNKDNDALLQELKAKSVALCNKFPLYK